MKVLGAQVLANCILGQQPVKTQTTYKTDLNQPSSDMFVKEVKNDMNCEAEINTKKIIKNVIVPNFSSETAIINNFDPEEYPRGIVDGQGEIIVQDEKLKKMFQTLAEAIPEYGAIYGRPQHETHQYTLDVHTFKVLKECINNPEYNELSDNDKMIVQMSILLHDIAKPAYKADKQHPGKSAFMTMEILDKLNFPQETNSRIIDLVKNHGWFEDYNKGFSTAEDVLENLADPKDFKLLGIITKADSNSVNDWFYDEYCTNLPNAIEEIKQKI